ERVAALAVFRKSRRGGRGGVRMVTLGGAPGLPRGVFFGETPRGENPPPPKKLTETPRTAPPPPARRPAPPPSRARPAHLPPAAAPPPSATGPARRGTRGRSRHPPCRPRATAVARPRAVAHCRASPRSSVPALVAASPASRGASPPAPAAAALRLASARHR